MLGYRYLLIATDVSSVLCLSENNLESAEASQIDVLSTGECSTHYGHHSFDGTQSIGMG